MAGAKLYDSVPNEIAMMVWKQAVHTSGVHHLRFFVMNRDDDGHLLGVKAWETTHKLKNAVSTWHHRYTISHIDKLSEDVYMKWVANLRAKNSLWIAPLKHKKVKEEHPVGTHTAERFKVDSFRDLVVVTFTESYINFDLLDEEANRDRFRGLRRIGLNYKQTQTGNSWGTCPFQCTCHRKSHKDWDHCPVRIVQFLHFFPDIEHVYLIIRVAATNLVLPKSVKLGGEAAKKAAADRRREAIGKQPNVDKSDKVIGSKVTKKPLKTSRKPVPKQILTAEEIIERHLAAVHRKSSTQSPFTRPVLIPYE